MIAASRTYSRAIFNLLSQRRSYNLSATPLKVLVSGAAGQIGYSILPMIASGQCFGKDVPVELNLYDIPATESIMHGIRMELEDCAFDPLVKVNVFTKPEDSFKNIDYGIMLANKQVLTADMTRAELLVSNRDLYCEMGEYFSKHAKKDAKILMIANPANTNCYIMMKNASSRSPLDFSSLSRLDSNRLGRMLADKLNVSVDMVRKYVVWGNHAASMYPDMRLAEFTTDNSPFSVYKPVTDVLDENGDWVKKVLTPKVKDRAFEVIRARKKSSSLSAANAAVDHLRDLHCGTREGHWASMGVYLKKNKYGIPEDIYFSMPCICYDGKHFVVENLPLSAHAKECLLTSAEDLLEEKRLAGF